MTRPPLEPAGYTCLEESYETISREPGDRYVSVECKYLPPDCKRYGQLMCPSLDGRVGEVSHLA